MTILCYHTVDPDWTGSPLAVTPERFDRHCAWLTKRRAVVDLTIALDRLDRRGRLPRGTVAVTLDDGLSGVYDHGFEILRRRRVPATVFLVAGTLAAGGRPVDWVDTAPSWPLRTMTGDQVLEMRDAGIRFGSHTFAHRDLTALDHRECVRDLRESRELLEDLLHEPVPLLAYPRGRHNAEVRRAARTAGYSHALTLPEAHEPLGAFAVPRVGVHPQNDVGTLWAKTGRAWLGVKTHRLYPAVRGAVRRARGGHG